MVFMVILRSLVAAALGMAVLAVWRLGHEIGCIALWFVPLVALPIALGQWEGAMFRRCTLVNATFRQGTLLHRLFRGGAITFLIATAMALVTGIMLLLDLIVEEGAVLYVLALDTVLLFLLMTLLDKALRPALHPHARRIVTKSWASWINAAFLVALKIAYDFHALRAPLQQGDGYTTYSGPLEATHCGILSALLALLGRIDGRLRVEMEVVDATLPGLALWISFLALSAFGAFGFSRYMVEILDWARRREKDV